MHTSKINLSAISLYNFLCYACDAVDAHAPPHYDPIVSHLAREIVSTFINKLDSNDIPTLFDIACHNGNLNVAQHLLSFCPYMFADKTTREPILINTFHSVCTKGHVNVVKWMLATFPDTLGVPRNDGCAFRSACENGWLYIAYLLAKQPAFNAWLNAKTSTEMLKHCFECLCEDGRTRFAIWFLHAFPVVPKIINVEECLQRILHWGHFKMARWFIRKFTDRAPYGNVHNHSWWGALYEGNWMNMGVDIDNLKNDTALKQKMQQHIATIQRIHTLFIEKHVHTTNYKAHLRRWFVLMLHNPNGEHVAKWLLNKWLQDYTPSVNRHCWCFDSWFRTACIRSHIEVAKKLQEIAPDRYILTRVRVNNEDFPTAISSTTVSALLPSKWTWEWDVRAIHLRITSFSEHIEDSDIEPETATATAQKASDAITATPICSICNDTQAEVITQCNHTYCCACIQQWAYTCLITNTKPQLQPYPSRNMHARIKLTISCPCCRTDVSTMHSVADVIAYCTNMTAEHS